MALTVSDDRLKQVARFNRLVEARKKIAMLTQNWMSEAVALRSDLTDSSERQEIVALRTAFINDLKAALGL